MNPKGKINKTNLLISLLVAAAVVGGYFVTTRDNVPPTIVGPEIKYIGQEPLTFIIEDAGSGIKNITYKVEQNGSVVLEESVEVETYKDFTTKEKTVEINLGNGDVKEGDLSVTFNTTDWGWMEGNSLSRSFKYTIDLRPPTASVVSRTHYINQGGSGLVVFNASDDTVRAGVLVGDLELPAFKQENGSYAAMVPFPHYIDDVDDFKPVVFVEDEAGNRAKAGFYYYSNPRNFRTDKVTVSDKFLSIVTPQFSQLVEPNADLIDIFLYVNKDLRAQNRSTLSELAKNTSPSFLGEGGFLRNKGANKARFGDRRKYAYDGDIVDEQTHLGIDIAANAQYPVLAASSGKVVFADFLGIYGNCVVIDHGLGLQTLYGHLSSIADVHVGDNLNKGDVIGKSGATGMAAGDHLHYAVLISGIPVNPIEWWDETWVKNNITSKRKLLEVNND